MNLKKKLIAIPLSVSLLLPAGVPLAFAADHDHGGPASMEVSNPATDLRAALDSILSEHAYLAVVTMQKGIDGAKDFDAAAAQLSENTDELSAAVASVYGEDAGNQFKEIWSSHIGYFVDYVTATANKDEDGRKKALADLDGYRVTQADFLDKATDSRLKAADLEEGLKMHVDQLIWAFDNYVAGDYDKAYSSLYESMHHMFGTGKGLSWAITDQFPEKFDNHTVDTPAADLREALNNQFSAHAALAIITMQKGIDGAPDFETAAATLNQNTEDLTASVESVYGAEGAKQFNEIWNSHIGYFVDYVTATAKKDADGQKKAMADLDAYRVTQAAFLDTATEGRLKAADLEEGLKGHVDQLLMAFDNYVAGDYDATYDNIHEAYSHMFGVGTALSGAIVDQYPDKFTSAMPADMPKTGLGGMSDGPDYTVLWIVASLIFALGAGTVLMRRKTVKEQ
ncbi:copper amine oxidase [Sporosarcina sp. Sa2YVA2]|uniref:Copper amine oxidase n=1 Tax=Sporosarcina quadrami TaxID=2762234 RepID=A0ABR8U9Z0_9BACL|nr:copper amine oxidase [Sporosarcina quadrami]MBD7984851.1 copper amine oxidase [Sporosarcina quadrami]